MTTAQPGPNPGRIFETISAYQQTAALRAAIDLEVFTRIAEGHQTAEAIATACSATLRGIRILCDYLTIYGFLTKQDGSYALTQDSAIFLDKRSPAYMGTISRFMGTPDLTRGFDDIAAVIRSGQLGTAGSGVVDQDDPVWVEFAQSMVPLVRPAAKFIAELAAGSGPLHVLDIAAGHGIFGIEIALKNPQATITALDWRAVLEVAQQNAAAHGVADRYATIPGDAFAVDYGGPYDLVLLTNFLHHFDLETCGQLVRKVKASLAPGGKVITLEFIPNDDRVTPPMAATFSMMMLGATPSGDAYTFKELQALFASAGLTHSEFVPIPQSPEALVVSSE